MRWTPRTHDWRCYVGMVPQPCEGQASHRDAMITCQLLETVELGERLLHQSTYGSGRIVIRDPDG